jgi:hypothetical protein
LGNCISNKGFADLASSRLVKRNCFRNAIELAQFYFRILNVYMIGSSLASDADPFRCDRVPLQLMAAHAFLRRDSPKASSANFNHFSIVCVACAGSSESADVVGVEERRAGLAAALATVEADVWRLNIFRIFDTAGTLPRERHV